MAVLLSMVALGKDARISGRAICDAWRTRWPRATPPVGMEKKESTFSFHVDEHLIAFALMPAPIPGMTDSEQPAARTAFWPNAAADLRQHERHVIVTVVGGTNPIDEMCVLTHRRHPALLCHLSYAGRCRLCIEQHVKSEARRIRHRRYAIFPGGGFGLGQRRSVSRLRWAYE